jgi:hypothetical protein
VVGLAGDDLEALHHALAVEAGAVPPPPVEVVGLLDLEVGGPQELPREVVHALGGIGHDVLLPVL